MNHETTNAVPDWVREIGDVGNLPIPFQVYLQLWLRFLGKGIHTLGQLTVLNTIAAQLFLLIDPTQHTVVLQDCAVCVLCGAQTGGIHLQRQTGVGICTECRPEVDQAQKRFDEDPTEENWSRPFVITRRRAN